MLENPSRLFAFARHMPMAKLLRRIELDARRRVRDRFPVIVAGRASAPPTAAEPPAAIFPPRAHLAPTLIGGGAQWRFKFLGRIVDMPAGTVDWSAPGPGGANQLWRMNLHYMEYLEGVADDVWPTLVDSWIAANPAHKPLCWRDAWNSYAVSLRVTVWLQELARRRGSLPSDAVRRTEVSAAEQICFLAANLETDLGGNHLIKNIKALLWASAYFTGSQAKSWRHLGLRLLEAEIGKQILADGMHYERSPSYHCQVFADLLECRHALGANLLAGRLDDALARMAQATADLAHPDGEVALFNDAGLCMAYNSGECMSVYERIFGTRPAQKLLFAYDAAGYFGQRVTASYTIVDCGRIAPDDLPAHGHGDVLSFEWSVAGRRVVVDQGVFEYSAGARRQLSRAAARHNTLCLEGADQADFFGAFRCGRRPNVEVRRYEAHGEGFLLEGAHDGFAHLPDRPRHVRTFDIRPGRIEIVDRIEGNTDRRATIGFLLHPDCRVEVAGTSARITSGEVTVDVGCDTPIRAEPAVWWPDMGVELVTTRLVVNLAPAPRAHVCRLEAAGHA